LSWYNSVLDKHIILIADIDARGIELSPIGDLGCFTGVFDGNGLIIKNISIAESGSDYVGLFSIIYAGQVSRLGLPSIDVSGNKYVGGLVGYNIGGQINSCYVTGSVSGQSFVGGLAGCSIIAAE
jgi:hypothetical protein